MTDVLVEFAQTLIQGLLYGGIYALAALGLSMIFSVIGVLNLAHGDFIMLGGFAGLILASAIPSTYGIFTIIIIFLIVFALIGSLGAGFELALIRPTFKRTSEGMLISSILITVGTAFIIENLGYNLMPRYILGHQTVFAIPFIQANSTFAYAGIFVNGVYVIAFAAVAVSTILLYFFSKRTYLGKAMRAVPQNPESARLMGINLQKISILTFALGSGFAGIAGVSIGIISTLSPGFGLTYTISLLSVMVLGGTRSYWGPLAGGLIIGFAQDFVASPLVNPVLNLGPFQIQDLAYWSPAVSIIILIIVLMIKPSGLAGRARSTKV
ncbi:MAG: branched-chain amino acid ABC transporter permease [Nitrososphaerales archaeon]